MSRSPHGWLQAPLCLVDHANVGLYVQLSRGNKQGNDLRRRLCSRIGQAAQLSQQVCALPPEHAVKLLPIA
jgi:hypothetical protein